MGNLIAPNCDMKASLAIWVILCLMLGPHALACSDGSFTDVSTATGGQPGKFNVSAIGSAPPLPSPVEDLIPRKNVIWDGRSSRFIKVTGDDPSTVYASAFNTLKDLLDRVDENLDKTRLQINHLQKLGKTPQDQELQDALQKYYEGELRRQWLENERMLLILARLSQDLEEDHASVLPGAMMIMLTDTEEE